MNERLNRSLDIVRDQEGESLPYIQGSFLIERTPTIRTYAPKEIESACVGLEVPIRWPALLGYDTISVEQDDLIASLLIQSREELADWFELPDGRPRTRRPANWAFNVGAGKAAIDSAVTTDAYYRYLISKNR